MTILFVWNWPSIPTLVSDWMLSVQFVFRCILVDGFCDGFYLPVRREFSLRRFCGWMKFFGRRFLSIWYFVVGIWFFGSVGREKFDWWGLLSRGKDDFLFGLWKPRMKKKNFCWAKCFLFRRISPETERFFLVLCFGFLCFSFVVHLMVLPFGEKLYAQVVDLRSIMHSLVGVVSSLVAGLGFGKPYSPISIYACGFILNLSVSLMILHMPGLYDWVDKCIPMISCFVLYGEYFCRGR